MPLHGAEISRGSDGKESRKFWRRDYRRFLLAQSRDSADRSFCSGISKKDSRGLRISRIGGGEPEDRRIWDGDVECVSRGPQVPRLSFARRDGPDWKRSGRRKSPLPLRAVA